MGEHINYDSIERSSLNCFYALTQQGQLQIHTVNTNKFSTVFFFVIQPNYKKIQASRLHILRNTVCSQMGTIVFPLVKTRDNAENVLKSI